MPWTLSKSQTTTICTIVILTPTVSHSILTNRSMLSSSQVACLSNAFSTFTFTVFSKCRPLSRATYKYPFHTTEQFRVNPLDTAQGPSGGRLVAMRFDLTSFRLWLLSFPYYYCRLRCFFCYSMLCNHQLSFYTSLPRWYLSNKIILPSSVFHDMYPSYISVD